MSSPERRRQKELERAEEQRLDDIERCRKANLNMYDRIEESDASSDVKEILHKLAEKLGVEFEVL